MNRRLLRLTEAQELLALGRTTTYALVRSGDLESVKVGRALRIPTDAVESLVSRLRADQGSQPQGSEIAR